VLFRSEGGKPGWNDAMNGLPGIVGSGMSETYEALRILKYLRKTVDNYKKSVYVPVEFATLLQDLTTALAVYNAVEGGSTAESEFVYWNSSNNARELYRESTMISFDGKLVKLPAATLVPTLVLIEQKVNEGIDRAIAQSSDGLSPTYFYYECSGYEFATWVGPNKVNALSFNLHGLPLFLEGPTRHLKIVNDIEKKREIYNLVKKSTLYDAELKMFTMSESLADVGQDVGRMKAFSPGWLENQSVWLHMSYKFYLELLRGGLYAEFFEEIKTGLVPFMDNEVYGRSPVEAASFIVSSAFPDPKMHGAGFLARLSGSTAEFLSMYYIIMAGANPFTLDDAGNLLLQFKPVIPGWLFTDAGTVEFTFLGSVKVTYHNTLRLDTWNIVPKTAVCTDKLGHASFDDDAIFDSIYANKVRGGDIESIDVYF